jgi:inositol phosphorylceramide mannosyltransferase catalytic subunit
MSDLIFSDLDNILLAQKGRIIHQVWFGTIPNKSSAKKAYKKLKIYRDSWKIQNPTWFHIEWNKTMCMSLISSFYSEHTEMFKKYRYEIQRCDAIRYIILHRYGGWYADMDYFCNRPFDQVNYSSNVYLVQSPNTVITQENDYISNSLMYSTSKNPFWRQVMLELEKNSEAPYYYTKHMVVMFTTGPAILNRIYSKWKYNYKVKSLPWKLFHPYGVCDDIRSINNLEKEVYSAHISKGAWSGKDTIFFNTILQDWPVLLLIILSFVICYIYIKIAF